MTKLEEVALLKEQMRSLLTTAKMEQRDLTENERSKFDDILARKNQIVLDETLRSLENNTSPIRSLDKSAVLTNAICDIYHQRSLDEYGENVGRGGIDFLRSADPVINDTGSASPMISTTIGDIIKPLEKGLVIEKLGLRMQYGIVGELTFPTLAAIEASIEGENTKVVDTKLEIGNLKANPWRVAVSVPVSNSAIDQTNGQLADVVLEQLSLATARTLNKVMFSTAKVGLASKGVFVKDVPNLEYETVLSFADIVSLETDVMDAGIDVSDGTAAYICNPKAYGELKTTPIEKSSPIMILKDGMMNGYPVIMTNYMGAGEVGFGVFSNSGIGQWGKIRLTIDDKSLASTDETKFTLNSKYDIITARPEAFAIAKKKEVSDLKSLKAKA